MMKQKYDSKSGHGQLPYQPCTDEYYKQMEEKSPIDYSDGLYELINKFEQSSEFEETELDYGECATGACPSR